MLSTFRTAVFEEVCRQAPALPIMRIEVVRRETG
jgi:hypothetical protein